MRPYFIFRSKSGSALVNVLMASGVGAILMLSLSSIMKSQQKESTRLFQKFALLDTGNAVRSTLSNPANCLYNLSLPGTFNASGVPTSGTPLASKLIILTDLRHGSDASGRVITTVNQEIETAKGVTAKEIYLTNWLHNGSGNYTADLVIEVQSNSGPMAPLKISGVSITATGGIGARAVAGCSLGGSSGASGATTILDNVESGTFAAVQIDNIRRTLGSLTIPPNTNAKILIEAEVKMRNTSTSSYSYNIIARVGGADVNSTGLIKLYESGPEFVGVVRISTIIAGGQSIATPLTIDCISNRTSLTPGITATISNIRVWGL